MENKSSWYSAKLLFMAHTAGQPEADPLCEESIILLRATNEDSAKEQANVQGKKLEHSYENEDGQRIEWKLVDVIEVQDLCEKTLKAGVEVFSHLFLLSKAPSRELKTIVKRRLRSRS